MKMWSLLLASMLVGLAGVALAAAPAEEKYALNDAASLANWKVTGDAAIDTSKDRAGGAGGSLRLGPGSKVVRQFRESNDGGKVELWVYDEVKNPKDLKERRVGPRWGLLQADGRVLVIGIIHAPYLSGGDTYATSDSDQKAWFTVQHSRAKRAVGWHKWTFDFDPEKGLTILYDGKKATGFDWNKTQIKGFAGVALFGDNSAEQQQTVWLDDVTITPGGAMKAVPTPPPPPPPVVPEVDPPVEKTVPLAAAVKGKHPRLLFGAEDVPAMKQLLQTPQGKIFFEQLMAYRGSCRPPTETAFLTDATDAQRQGMWRLPTVALHYVLTGDKNSLEAGTGFLKKFTELENWETGQERDCGMGAANIMVGAALAYDWLYDGLDPAFRDGVRKKLLLQARRMYHGGHLIKQPGTHYWQSDPQNNHRYHRDAGLGLAVLAIAGDGPGDEWITAQTFEELKFIHDWLPEDGTCHESPSYMIFGGPYLMLAMQAADRCFGTQYLDHPFFKAAPLFRLHTLAPGMKDAFCYGDAGGLGFINNYMFKAAARHRLADVQAGLWQSFEASRDAWQYGWFSILWFDPTLTGGSIDRLPKAAFWPDLGITTVRDRWDAGGVAALFKCGPYGGRKLNEFRNKNEFKYLNVAHDDPDANMFTIFAGGAFLADDDRYSTMKVTSSHNTILVNGKGQQGEGKAWTQPLKGDMTGLATATTWKQAGDVVVSEGEAAGLYAGLQRFRRTFIWVKGSYVLVLDDIRSNKPAEITWLAQGPELEAVSVAEQRYVLKKGGATCGFRLASDREFAAVIADSTADHRGKPLGYKQVQAKAATPWRLAAAFNPWNLAKLDVELKAAGDSAATVTVTGPDFTDTWQWQAAPDGQTPSTIRGDRKGGFSISVGPPDKAPLGGPPVTK